MNINTYEVVTTVKGCKESFKDHYQAETESGAIVMARVEADDCGIPADATQVATLRNDLAWLFE